MLFDNTLGHKSLISHSKLRRIWVVLFTKFQLSADTNLIFMAINIYKNYYTRKKSSTGDTHCTKSNCAVSIIVKQRQQRCVIRKISYKSEKASGGWGGGGRRDEKALKKKKKWHTQPPKKKNQKKISWRLNLKRIGQYPNKAHKKGKLYDPFRAWLNATSQALL